MTKLTKAQIAALRAMPFTYTTWGGELMTSLPAGVRSRLTLTALYRLGLADSHHAGTRDTWSVTDAGRAALSQADPTQGETK